MPLKAVSFDWGHTVMDECRDGEISLDLRPVHLMPGVSEVLPQIALPLALWANTRVAAETDVRGWLERAGLNTLFRWVITSVDAGARKPAPEFFQYALARCGLAREDVLFVGNRLPSCLQKAEGRLGDRQSEAIRFALAGILRRLLLCSRGYSTAIGGCGGRCAALLRRVSREEWHTAPPRCVQGQIESEMPANRGLAAATSNQAGPCGIVISCIPRFP